MKNGRPMMATEPNEDPALSQLTKLALAVIQEAVHDATLDLPAYPSEEKHASPGAFAYAVSHWSTEKQARDEARYFLTTDNAMLRFWCRVAGFDPRTVLHYAKGAAKDWEALGRKHKLHGIGEPEDDDNDEENAA